MFGITSITDAHSRSITPENPTGAPGRGGRATEGTGAEAAADLGPGWKVSPSIKIPPRSTAQLAHITGPAKITHIWVTTSEDHWRGSLLRAHWDDDPEPAVEVPLGDFFGQGWGVHAPLSSVPIAVNSRGGLNSYWPMPFRDRAKLTLENLTETEQLVYFQIDYELAEVETNEGYLHAQWRRSNPVTGGLHPIVHDVVGTGHYAGTYLAWGSNSSHWWGEGEMKFYLDDDLDSTPSFPTICGTGLEDYVGGAWGFEVPPAGYATYSTAFLGFHQDLQPDRLWRSQHRFGVYRWHIPDPIRFRRHLRVEVQALGWRKQQRYLKLHDDVASTAVLYLNQTSTERPTTPDLDALDVL